MLQSVVLSILVSGRFIFPLFYIGAAVGLAVAFQQPANHPTIGMIRSDGGSECGTTPISVLLVISGTF